MRDLRIVFMGTPEFAVASLDKIITSGYLITGVVTAPDKPAGRGRRLQESAVKKYAVQKDIPVLQPSNLKSSDFLRDLKNLNPNIQIVVAFRMLPKIVWNLPEYGTFNLHASLLPQYRGAAPINWAIINGENRTGVTTFFLDEKIDTGELIMQKAVEIKNNEDAGSLHDKLMTEGANLTIETLHVIAAGSVKTEPQQSNKSLKTAQKLTRENTKINWSAPLSAIYDSIRGLSPYPAAWTEIQNGKDKFSLKIYAAEIENIVHDLETGKLIQKEKNVKIAVKEGFVVLKEIQIPGKRKMSTKDLLNGYRFFPNAKAL